MSQIQKWAERLMWKCVFFKQNIIIGILALADWGEKKKTNMDCLTDKQESTQIAGDQELKKTEGLNKNMRQLERNATAGENEAQVNQS